MNAAITSVYMVMAAWTPVTVVSRSATICEIETFITLESSTITNCAAARMIRGSQRRIMSVLRRERPELVLARLDDADMRLGHRVPGAREIAERLRDHDPR